MGMKNLDFTSSLLLEGRLDLMHLPAGAIAWLWVFNRPSAQVDSAKTFAAMAKQMDDPVVDGGILRADRNVLVLHTASGMKVSVYPDGGLGSNGEPISAHDVQGIFLGTGNGALVEPEMGVTDPLPVSVNDPAIDGPATIIDEPVTMDDPPLIEKRKRRR